MSVRRSNSRKSKSKSTPLSRVARVSSAPVKRNNFVDVYPLITNASDKQMTFNLSIKQHMHNVKMDVVHVKEDLNKYKIFSKNLDTYMTQYPTSEDTVALKEIIQQYNANDEMRQSQDGEELTTFMDIYDINFYNSGDRLAGNTNDIADIREFVNTHLEKGDEDDDEYDEYDENTIESLNDIESVLYSYESSIKNLASSTNYTLKKLNPMVENINKTLSRNKA